MVRIVVLRLLESYFRHRWLYLAPIIIALLSAGVYIVSRPPNYVASGQIYVADQNLLANLTASNPTDMWVTASEATVAELTEMLSTQAFIRSIIKKTDLEQDMSGGPVVVDETIIYVRKILSVESLGDKLVGISATSDDPTIAFQLVRATLDAYVQWKINSGHQESAAASKFFDNLVEPYQKELDQNRSDLVTFLTEHPLPVRGERPSEEQVEIDRLQALVTKAEERVTSTRDNADSARLAQAKAESVTKQTYIIIDQPQVPENAVLSLSTITSEFTIFLVVGMIITVIGIVGGALLDRSIRFPVDVRHGLSLPVLAMVPVATPIPRAPATTERATSVPSASADSDDADEESRGDPRFQRPRAS